MAQISTDGPKASQRKGDSELETLSGFSLQDLETPWVKPLRIFCSRLIKSEPQDSHLVSTNRVFCDYYFVVGPSAHPEQQRVGLRPTQNH